MDKSLLERFGIAATTACAVHCVITPFLSLLPFVGSGLLADEHVEWLLICVSLAMGSLNLFPDYLRHHQRLRPLAIFALGGALVLAARLWFEDELQIGTPLAVLGAGAILGAYWINRRLCQTCNVCQTTPTEN